MGVTLSRAARWTSVDGNQGTLDITPINEHIINEITQFVTEFVAKNPEEAKVLFKKPLEWTTDNLSYFSVLTGANYTTKYLD